MLYWLVSMSFINSSANLHKITGKKVFISFFLKNKYMYNKYAPSHTKHYLISVHTCLPQRVLQRAEIEFDIFIYFVGCTV